MDFRAGKSTIIWSIKAIRSGFIQKTEGICLSFDHFRFFTRIVADPLHHWETQFENLEKKWLEQNNTVAELKKEHASLTQKYLMAENQAKDLAEQLQLLAHEKWTLGQEKAQLMGQLKQLDAILAKKYKELV